MKTELHCMVDIETLGNDPKFGLIMAMAAVIFDPYGEEVNCARLLPMENAVGTDEMYVILSQFDGLRSGFSPDDETLNWWLHPDRVQEYARMSQYKDATSYAIAFRSLRMLVLSQQPEPAEMFIWSHGATFDAMHVKEKFLQLEKLGHVDMENPFPFRHMMDTRTLFKIHKDLYGFDVEWPARQQKHHPLDDARVQCVAVQRTLKSLKLGGRRESNNAN